MALSASNQTLDNSWRLHFEELKLSATRVEEFDETVKDHQVTIAAHTLWW